MSKNYIIINKFIVENSVFYKNGNDIINDKDILDYIKKLVIPPAYTSVKIYYPKNKNVKLKILYEGYDSKNRKQVIYSKEWVELQEKYKYKKLIEFVKNFSKIQQKITKHLKEQRLSKNKLIATILQVIIYCNFRIGGHKYEKLYNTYGISNIKVKHINLNENGVYFKFIGKKNVENSCQIHSTLLKDIFEKLIINKGSEENIFTVNSKVITEKDVNDYLKKYNKDFSTKMFRTFNANLYLIDFLNKDEEPSKMEINKRKKNIISAIKNIAEKINNSPAIAKKNYINNTIINLYIDKPLKYKKLFIDGEKNTSERFIKFLIKYY